MVKWLVALAIAWPLLLTASVWQRATNGPTAWTAIVHAVGSRICHQKPERSFHTDGVQWPVCGRCSGLYLAAPIGALIAAWRRKRHDVTRTRVLLAIAAIPTAATILLEWSGVPMGNAARFLSALPLGAAGAFAVIRAAARPADRPLRQSPAIH